MACCTSSKMMMEKIETQPALRMPKVPSHSRQTSLCTSPSPLFPKRLLSEKTTISCLPSRAERFLVKNYFSTARHRPLSFNDRIIRTMKSHVYCIIASMLLAQTEKKTTYFLPTKDALFSTQRKIQMNPAMHPEWQNSTVQRHDTTLS